MHTTVHSKTASAHTAVHANAAGMMVRPVAATMLDASWIFPKLHNLQAALFFGLCQNCSRQVMWYRCF